MSVQPPRRHTLLSLFHAHSAGLAVYNGAFSVITMLAIHLAISNQHARHIIIYCININKEMKVYHYKCDGFDDTGFGCVYRNAQTCMSALGLDPVPDIQTLLKYFHGPTIMAGYRSMPAMKLWLEPYDVGLYFSSELPQYNTHSFCYSPTVDMVHLSCHRTPRCAYTSHNTFYDFDAYLTGCRAHLSANPGIPILIDNGVYSFCLKEIIDDGVVVLIDPHVTDPKSTERTMVDLTYLRQHVWYSLAFSSERVEKCQKGDP